MVLRHAVTALALCAIGGAAQAATVLTVPGSSNPYLAGMPAGSTASRGDVAPDHSPVEATGLGLAPGQALTFQVTGFSSYTGSASGPGPDGGANFRHFPGAQNGLSQVFAPIDALMGVFLGDERPDLSDAPDALSFWTEESRDFATLAPATKQVFFIGDGLDGSDATQSFVVPEGGTRLFLGSMDGFGWFNNTGAFEVTIHGGAATPEPGPGPDPSPDPTTPAPIPLPAAAWGLLLGLASLGALSRRRRPA